MITIIVDKLCPQVSWMSDTSSISGMSGISNISSRTFVSEESSLVLEVLEPDRHHYYLVPLQVKTVILSWSRCYLYFFISRLPRGGSSRRRAPSCTSTWTTPLLPNTSSCKWSQMPNVMMYTWHVTCDVTQGLPVRGVQAERQSEAGQAGIHLQRLRPGHPQALPCQGGCDDHLTFGS